MDAARDVSSPPGGALPLPVQGFALVDDVAAPGELFAAWQVWGVRAGALSRLAITTNYGEAWGRVVYELSTGRPVVLEVSYFAPGSPIV